jgi:hypothetical protein
MEALKKIEKDKRRVARAYNKKVKAKSFQVGDLVWKTILPIGSKSNKFGKWSPSWEGPYKVVKVCSGNSLHGGNFARTATSEGYQWEVLEDISSKCLAGCLIGYGRFRVKIALRSKNSW